MNKLEEKAQAKAETKARKRKTQEQGPLIYCYRRQMERHMKHTFHLVREGSPTEAQAKAALVLLQAASSLVAEALSVVGGKPVFTFENY